VHVVPQPIEEAIETLNGPFDLALAACNQALNAALQMLEG
jgi:hypothetical protein